MKKNKKTLLLLHQQDLLDQDLISHLMSAKQCVENRIEMLEIIR